jgi:beta-glucosidase
MHESRNFPAGFLWGAATSSHQVEGGNHNDWTAWEAQPGRILDGTNADVACDHYRRYEADFDLAKELGHNAHRFSLEWSRIEPEEGRWDMAEVVHYREVLLALKARGLKSMVTAWHFTLPTWLAAKGGWEHPDAPRLFARYCAFVAREYGDLVDLWITINEPMVYLACGYVAGTWPPGKTSLRATVRAFLNLCRGHRLAYRSMHAAADAPGRRLQIGIAQNCQVFKPFRRRSLLDTAFAWSAERLNNHAFFMLSRRCHDFIGINYYFYYRVRFKLPCDIKCLFEVHVENREVSDLGWEINPHGMYEMLTSMRRYRLPIYISENGVANADDTKRPRFIVGMIEEMLRAMKAGADVRGYFHWALLDNFEWEKGLTPRFGLVAVDYATQQRTPRPSAYLFKDICVNNRLSD